MGSRGRIVGIFVVLLLVIQLIGDDRSVPNSSEELSFKMVSNASDSIMAILQNSCYDCHSYQTIYPWYTKVAPVSWIIDKEVQEGRMVLNFSIWGAYSLSEQDSLSRLIIDEVQNQSMPTQSYIRMHKQAQLTLEEVRLLERWIKDKLALNKANTK